MIGCDVGKGEEDVVLRRPDLVHSELGETGSNPVDDFLIPPLTFFR